VLGSQRSQLIAQFLSENMIMALLSLVIGLIFAEFLVPAYNKMWPFLDIHISFTENISFYIFLVVLLLFTGLIAGSYPAFYISSFKPSHILRGTLKYGSTSVFTMILLTFQFSISLVAVVSGVIFTQNAEYQKNYDLGFDEESVVYAFVKDEDGYNALTRAIEDNNKIESIAGGRHSYTASWYTDPIAFNGEELDVQLLDIGANYLATTSSTILEGRNFVEGSQTDVENSVIINEELVKRFGWDKPIGQRIILRDTVELFVVGVVKNVFLNGGLWDPVRPLLLRYVKPEDYRWLVARGAATDMKEIYEEMEASYKVVFPDELPNVRYMDENMAETMDININIRKMFVFLGAIAAILSAIGLFSLVSLDIIKRMKEIGVRKVLGASTANIVKIINKRYIIILSVASVLGSVLGYFMADMLMASIWTYYLPIGPIAFILSITLLIVIAMVTVGGKVIRAAQANPSTTLRDE
jgi:hypothetical protein